MKIPLSRRIAYRLAKSAVIAALFLGVTLSSLQVVIDFHDRDNELERTLERILLVAQQPATDAAFSINQNQAEGVLAGLMEYNFIVQASIVDDRNTILAEARRPPMERDTRVFTRLITDEFRKNSVELLSPGDDATVYGVLTIQVDRDHALSGFFENALIIFAIGLVRNFTLSRAHCFDWSNPITKLILKIRASSGCLG